ncbi:MAG: hypothetical protein ACLQU1_22030 [Bryobacteraceae bacterium]
MLLVAALSAAGQSPVPPTFFAMSADEEDYPKVNFGALAHQAITDLATEVAWIARYNLLQAGLRSTLNLQMTAWFTWGGGTAFGWGDIEDDSLGEYLAANEALSAPGIQTVKFPVWCILR